MEKPGHCRICSSPLEQPSTGRPRVYCGPPCRRAAEYELRRLEAQLGMAEKRELLARETLAATLFADERAAPRKMAKYWATEVERLKRRLLELLAGAGDATGASPAREGDR